MNDTVKFLKGFGSQVHAMRKDRGLTQKEFAKVIGISSSYMASIEVGRRWPRANILYIIANNLGITTYELIYRAEHRNIINEKYRRSRPMNKSDMPVSPALDKVLDELQSKATEAGYPPRIVLNMRHHPEMLGIIARMIKAELECIKKEREDANLQKQK